MKITMAHYNFLCWKKVDRRLFDHLQGMQKAPSIHRLIPQDDQRDPDHAIGNTLSVLRMARDRGKLRSLLTEMSERPGTLVGPHTRKMMCRRWLARLEGKSRKHGLPFICTWCESAKLRVYETHRGFYVGCSEPSVDNCPDTTGTFPKRADAVKAAYEYIAGYKYGHRHAK